jgi:hypothetical protein
MPAPVAESSALRSLLTLFDEGIRPDPSAAL